MLLYQLLRPLSYMTIRDASKWKIDILLPTLLSIFLTLSFFYLPERTTLFGANGIIPLFVGLLQILPGFYLTALAAVATFNRPDMDQLMPSPAPTVSISVSGKNEEIKLTRRRMLAMLFGYLTFICFTLYFLCILSQIASPTLAEAIGEKSLNVGRAAFLAIFTFLLGQLIFITMFGLYQLSDRMHQPD
ncbi:MAG TPA: hypothetical protein VGN97_20390 [Mesorhizobium sp.]|jgi:preprotein translocase subunit SecG|nr:hypothetical protein [Mesorhizobium sp.]